jgi:hypothetical protein
VSNQASAAIVNHFPQRHLAAFKAKVSRLLMCLHGEIVAVPSIDVGITVARATKKGPIHAVSGLFFVADVMTMPSLIAWFRFSS